MQSEYSSGLSYGMFSASIMQLEPGQDSDVLSLFQHMQQKDDEQFRTIHKHMLRNFDTTPIKNNQAIGIKHDIKNQTTIQEQINNIRGYQSQCNEPYSDDYPLKIKKRRKTRIINHKQQKNKKRRLNLYIETLENRCAQLQSEIEKLRKLNKMNKDYIKKLNDSQQIINGFFVGKQQIYQKLQTITNQTYKQQLKLINQKKQQSISQIKINLQDILVPSDIMPPFTSNQQKLLDQVKTLRMRQGVFGKDRIKAINYYFREIIEMILPDVQKYMIITAQQQSDVFSKKYLNSRQHQTDIQDWRKQMIDQMQLSTQQIAFIQSLKQQLIGEKGLFDSLVYKFYEIKCQLSHQARKMQAIFDKINKKMTPIQLGNCLCYIEKYRFQKGISAMQSVREITQKLSNQQTYYNIKDPFDTKLKQEY